MNDTDRAILDLERQTFALPGAKEQRIRDLFDLDATRYYQRLGQVIDDPAALAYAPVVVGRLRRLRDQGQRRRRSQRVT